MKHFVSAIATGLWLALTLAASAQPYPNRPIRLIIPYSPGGIVDFAGRVLGNKL